MDKPKTPMCKGPGCIRPPVAKDLCTGHYQQLRRGRPLTPLRKYSCVPLPCQTPGCGGRDTGKGRCDACRMYFKRNGTYTRKPKRKKEPA